MESGIRLAGGGAGDSLCLAAFSCLAASPFHWGPPCISLHSLRNGTHGLLCCLPRWGFSFLRPGRKNFSSVACCKIYWRDRARATWRAGGRRRCFLDFRTSPTSDFRIGATSFSRPSPVFFTVGPGARQVRFLRQRLCTRWWISRGTSFFILDEGIPVP